MKRSAFILLFSMALCMGSAFGQGILKGIVTDGGSNDPLVGATIMLDDKSGGGFTDDEGKFELPVKKSPPFGITVTYVGFDTLTLQVTSLDQPLKLVMNENSVNVEVVEIVGMHISEKQKESPLTVESMGSIAIKEVAGSDFYASLGNMKGVDLTSASLGFKVINTRGFNSTSPVRSLQIIDGVDNQAPGLNFSLGNFLGASELDVQKVDLIVGASSAFYGPNAFNGVIAMTTKSPFIHKGLSVQARVGERDLAEIAVRYARAFQNKEGEDVFAFKVNAYAMRANDWPATNTDSTINSLVGINNPGGYDAVNVYGDENLSPGANNYTSNYGRRIYPGLGIYHRDGYREQDVVDYNTHNIKLSAAAHLKVLKGAELIAGSNFGTGTTVYQGDNRYSLKDILFFQHKLELKKEGKGFIRTYFTHEDAGNSYDAVFTAFQMQNAAKSDFEWSTDYANYWATNVVPKVQSLPGYPAFNFPWDEDFAAQDSLFQVYSDSIHTWHQEARDVANSANTVDATLERFTPGTAAFDSVLADITSRTAYAERGTKFFDLSKLWHMHGEYEFHPEFADITVGANMRVYLPYSEGTIFSDTAGTRIINKEAGAYLGIQRGLFEDRLKLSATVRVDKNQNFNFVVSPALSAVYILKADHVLRMAFNSAVRNPTLQDQYLYYNVGRAILVGNVDGRNNLASIGSIYDFFESRDRDTLEYFDVAPIRPEKVKSLELGYRGTFGERFFVDASYYYSFYTDFIGFKVGADITVDTVVNMLNINRVYRVAANADTRVTTQGLSLGANYYFGKYYMVNGNYSWNVLNKTTEDDPIIPAFNTPQHKWNMGFGGRNIPVKLGEKQLNNFGFNFNFKWVQGFRFEGSPQFTGDVPTYWLLDGQVNKKVQKIHTTFKVGASNMLNRQSLQVYGGPYIGRMVYFSALLELDKL